MIYIYIYITKFNIIFLKCIKYCRVSAFGLGPAADGIQAQRIHYNEFVESGSKKWALMGQRLVLKLGMIKKELRTQNQTAQRPEGKGSSSEDMNSHLVSLLKSTLQPPSFCGRSLMLYITSFGSSSSYTCQSPMPILECTSHRPLLLVLYELLWPRQHSPKVTSI